MHDEHRQTLDRQLTILRAIPLLPNSITVTQLLLIARDARFEASRRTIDRDLKDLSPRFPLVVDSSGKTHRWSLLKAASIEFMPRLTVSQSLALALAWAHVRSLLPKSMIDDLAPLFEAAERELAKTGWKDWHKRTAVAPVSFSLLPPTIDPKVLLDVHHALAGRLCLTATYQSKGNDPRPRTIHPQGLLVRGNTQYLICKLPEYDEPRQLCLHRMCDTEVGSERCIEIHGFSMSRYVRNLAIAPRGKIRVCCHFDAITAHHLRETPMSKYQTWRPIPGTDKVEVRATVNDDLEFKRWLLSFGSELEVMEPEHLRREMREELAKALGAYGD